MKLRVFSLSLFAMLLAAGALFTGCTNTTTPGNSVGYHDTWQDITGLTPGKTYTFNITSTGSGSAISGVSSYTSGTVRVYWTRGANDSSLITASANAASGITWAATTGASMIRLYETADNTSGHSSGLVLGTPGSTTDMPHSASVDGAEKGNIDLVLATDASVAFPGMSLGSAKAYGNISGNTRDADFGNPLPAGLFKGGLAAEMFSSGSLTSTIPNGALNFVDIGQKFTIISDSSSYVFTVHMLADDHWARVEIVPQTTVTTVNGVQGHYLWGDTGGTTSYRFIDVNVTYDPTAGQAYAANPVLRKRALLGYTGMSLGGFIR